MTNFFIFQEVSQACFCLNDLPGLSNNRHELNNTVTPYQVYRIFDGNNHTLRIVENGVKHHKPKTYNLRQRLIPIHNFKIVIKRRYLINSFSVYWVGDTYED